MTVRRYSLSNVVAALTSTILVLLATTAPARADMQDEVDQAVDIISRFQEIPEKSIPEAVLKDAKGIAVLTVLKGGFGFSGRIGKGVVMARHDEGWSGPSAIGTGGIGFGFQIGAQVSEFVFILNTNDAVRAFSRGGNVAVGGALSAAAGPFGRTAEAGVTPTAAVYTYSRSQGAFAGISLEGTVLAARDKANREYYGKDVTPSQILRGEVSPPAGADKLRQALSKY